MFCCPPGFSQSVPPPNAKAKEYVNYLRVIMFTQIIVALIKSIVFESILAGLYDLISALIIYQGYSKLSYINIMFALFINGYNLVQIFASIGTVIQNGDDPLGSVVFAGYAPAAITTYICFIFYTVLIVVCFWAYREFKAISFEGQGATSGTAYPTYSGPSKFFSQLRYLT